MKKNEVRNGFSYVIIATYMRISLIVVHLRPARLVVALLHGLLEGPGQRRVEVLHETWAGVEEEAIDAIVVGLVRLSRCWNGSHPARVQSQL